MQRYEQLRAGATCGTPAGGLGLAMLVDRGVTAWARACPRAAPAEPGRPVPALAGAQRPAIVGVLADMAIACIGGG